MDTNCKPLKVLLLRFSSIGDIVLTTPVIRALSQRNDMEIHFLTKKKFQDVLLHHPAIHSLHTFEKEIDELVPQLKLEKFDLVIDLHRNLRSARLKTALKVKSYSFSKVNLQKWLLVNFKMNTLPKVHIVERYMETLKPLGMHYDHRGLDYFSGVEKAEVLRLLPEKFQLAYHAFVVGGAHFTKQIPVEMLIHLAQQSPLPVVLLGGKEDEEKAELVVEALKDKTLNLCGKCSLNQSAAVLEHAQKVITADTGLMHIAAAYKKEIHSFWGNTVPDFGMYPLLPKGQEHLSHLHQVEGLSCRPCSKIGFNACPKKHFRCMKDIQLNKVFE